MNNQEIRKKKGISIEENKKMNEEFQKSKGVPPLDRNEMSNLIMDMALKKHPELGPLFGDIVVKPNSEANPENENPEHDEFKDGKLLPNPHYPPSSTLDSSRYYVASYPFLRNFQLVAIVSRETGAQEMRIEYLGEDGKVMDGGFISCIHTAITTTTLDEVQNIPPDTTNEEYFYGAKVLESGALKNVAQYDENEYSFEDEIDVDNEIDEVGNVDNEEDGENSDSNNATVNNLLIIELAPEEHFFALKSWVQAIAESGMDFFKNMEILHRFPSMFQIMKVILDFMARHDSDFLQDYLTFIERECVYDGKPHIPSLIASLVGFQDFIYYSSGIGHLNPKQYIYRKDAQYKGAWQLMEALLAMDLPVDVYMEVIPLQIMRERFQDHPEYTEKIQARFIPSLYEPLTEKDKEWCMFESVPYYGSFQFIVHIGRKQHFNHFAHLSVEYLDNRGKVFDGYDLDCFPIEKKPPLIILKSCLKFTRSLAGFGREFYKQREFISSFIKDQYNLDKLMNRLTIFLCMYDDVFLHEFFTDMYDRCKAANNFSSFIIFIEEVKREIYYFVHKHKAFSDLVNSMELPSVIRHRLELLNIEGTIFNLNNP